jgi:hypothetical protein
MAPGAADLGTLSDRFLTLIGTGMGRGTVLKRHRLTLGMALIERRAHVVSGHRPSRVNSRLWESALLWHGADRQRREWWPPLSWSTCRRGLPILT